MNERHNLKYDENEIFSINNIGLHLNEFVSELLDKHISDEDIKFWKVSNFKIDNDLCLVHRDLNSSNILLDDDNNVTAIIDLGFGGFENKYFDISRIIGRCPENFKKEIVKGYESYNNEDIGVNELNKNITTWNNIDNAYINYMRKIGIYNI